MTNSSSKNNASEQVCIGYSDEKLEALSKLQTRFESTIVPWAAWESENSSFGKAFRKWAYFPKFLPLYLSSDHGVHWGARCWPNEIESRFKSFFTWNKKKCNVMRKVHRKRAYHVSHPWVNYRKKYFPELPNARAATLVFYAHSNTTTTPVYDDLDKYINDLKALPEKYQPIVICLSFHDINKELHKKFRKYRLPLVTAGTTNSQLFVDRFYSLAYQFQFSSSSNIGSHTYYLMEAGIPFFLYGPYPQYKHKGSSFVKDGDLSLSNYGDDEDINELMKFRELLSTNHDEVTQEQYVIISKHLGLDSEMSRFRMSLILWWELFVHFGDLLTVYIRQVFKVISKITVFVLSKGKR
jgi:hypothetical protein